MFSFNQTVSQPLSPLPCFASVCLVYGRRCECQISYFWQWHNNSCSIDDPIYKQHPSNTKQPQSVRMQCDGKLPKWRRNRCVVKQISRTSNQSIHQLAFSIGLTFIRLSSTTKLLRSHERNQTKSTQEKNISRKYPSILEENISNWRKLRGKNQFLWLFKILEK